MIRWPISLAKIIALSLILLPDSAAAVPADSLASLADLPFSVCFKPERAIPASNQIRKRIAQVKPAIERLAGQFPHGKQSAGWIEALIIHESGGDPLAVSPTGCAGLLAFARPFEQTPACCKRDPGDRWEYEYDLCNSEITAGFGCKYDYDARFNPAKSIDRGFEDLEHFWSELESSAAGPARIDTTSALTAFWNAGTDLLPDFPNGIKSRQRLLERINFTGVAPYFHWTNHARANKLIEIYDYVAWIVALRGGKAPAEPELVCIDYRPRPKNTAGENTVRGTSRKKIDLKKMTPFRVRRLSFGIYKSDTAWISF